MAKNLDTYLKELQAAMIRAGADPALAQDALFDAEEYLRAEMAERYESEPSGVEEYQSRFAAVIEDYGTPEEVSAAYLGGSSTGGEVPQSGADGITSGGAASSSGGVPSAPTAPAPPPAPRAPVPPSTSAQPASGVSATAGAAAGATAAAGARLERQGVWRRFFGVVADPAVYKALAYMILSLATGIVYFTFVVTGLSTAGGMLVLIVGIPLLLLVLGLIRGMALLEGRLVEGLLDTRMPRRERAGLPEADWLQRMWFWVKDGRTWASIAYMILMLPLGIAYFTIAVAGVSAGFGLMGAPFVYWARGEEFVWHGVHHTFTLPLWTTPFGVILGVFLLVVWLHLIRWIGRGHAAFAKHMLVRLAQ